MRLIFHPESLVELTGAAQFYQSRVQGLGLEFLAAVDASLARIAGAPKLNRVHRSGARRLMVERFPYSIYYVILPDHIQILSFPHHSRRPGYWQSRIKE